MASQSCVIWPLPKSPDIPAYYPFSLTLLQHTALLSVPAYACLRAFALALLSAQTSFPRSSPNCLIPLIQVSAHILLDAFPDLSTPSKGTSHSLLQIFSITLLPVLVYLEYFLLLEIFIYLLIYFWHPQWFCELYERRECVCLVIPALSALRMVPSS